MLRTLCCVPPTPVEAACYALVSACLFGAVAWLIWRSNTEHDALPSELRDSGWYLLFETGWVFDLLWAFTLGLAGLWFLKRSLE